MPVAAEIEGNEGRGENVGQRKNAPSQAKETPKTARKMTRKELFNKISDDIRYVIKKERKKKIDCGYATVFQKRTGGNRLCGNAASEKETEFDMQADTVYPKGISE